MRVRLYHDETLDLKLEVIVANLNRLAPELEFALGKARFSMADDFVANPGTYRSLDYRIGEEIASDEVAILFTAKRYDNNYFWDSDDPKKIIVSLFGWKHLSDLSLNNGAVYLICAIIVRRLGIGHSHRNRNTGCINDFWGDKTGVNRGMRMAYVCESCIASTTSGLAHPQLKGVQSILDELGTASRAGNDICDAWDAGSRSHDFDLFVCHNSEDKPQIREINRRLQSHGIRTWLDEEQLPPGRAWQDLLEEHIARVKTAGIFVGGSGVGPWQNVEIRAFLQEFVRRQCPVIPIILGECQTVPQLPLFLSQLTWVDFRKSTPDPFERLLWGITGQRPSVQDVAQQQHAADDAARRR